jgi:hypothetical protein
MTAPVPEEIAEEVERQENVLRQTYPSWRSERMRRVDGTYGGWTAVRYAELKPEEVAAGLVPALAAADVFELVGKLAGQDAITQIHGGFR